MMNEVLPMKIKKEYIFLAVVIFAMAGYLFVKKTNRLHYSLPTTPVIANDGINRLEFFNGGRKTILTKKDGAWFISPENYPVDAGKIDRITRVIADFSLDTLASESGDYLRYDLTEEKKISVQVFGDKGPGTLFSFDIGKRAATGRHTFVTIQGDKRVFQALGNFRSDFEQGPQDLRDKKILSPAQDTLTSLQITEGGKIQELKKQLAEQAGAPQEPKPSATQKPNARWVDMTGKEIPESVMNEFFSQLSGLQCDSYLEGKKKEDFKDPIISIALRGEKGSTLSIFEKNDQKDKTYPALSSDNGYPFVLQTYKVEMIRKALKEIRGEKTEMQAGPAIGK
jgi:hypothetical protein